METTPSHRGEISALASANAPFLYFDGAPNFGLHNGIVNITLEAIRFSAVDHEIVPDRVIVAHLRLGLVAAQAPGGSACWAGRPYRDRATICVGLTKRSAISSQISVVTI